MRDEILMNKSHIPQLQAREAELRRENLALRLSLDLDVMSTCADNALVSRSGVHTDTLCRVLE
jgi:hypothetical protein